MANIDYTTLWADDPVKFDEITTGMTFNQGSEEGREPGKIFFRSRGPVPHKAIKEFSAKHPDMTFYAEHSFEKDWWSEVWTIEYKAGESREIKLEPSYMFSYEKEVKNTRQNVPCYAELEAKATEIFKRLDVQINGPDNAMVIDWCKDEITAMVEHAGYRMKATKIMNEVGGIIFYKAHEIKTVEWHQLNSSAIPDDDIPF